MNKRYTILFCLLLIAALLPMTLHTASAEETFSITWLNDDGSLLAETQVAAGETPVYPGETPTKETDADYIYTFYGWDPEPVPATEDATYMAIYSAQIRPDKCGDNLYWSFDESTGALTITGSGAMTDYYPSTIPWYSTRSRITSVILPDELTSIGDYAFYNCTSLTSVEHGESIARVGSNAFKNTQLFKSQTGLVYLDYILLGYNEVYPQSISINPSTRIIADNAFSECTTITQLTIPDSVTTIGQSAFYDCTGIQSLTIPCSTVFQLVSFYNCTSINSIRFTVGTGKMTDYTSHTSGYTPWYLSRENELRVIIEDGVTSIGDNAFKYCTGLRTVTIPDSVISIGDDAFSGCAGLTELSLPTSLAEIGKEAFRGCSGLLEFSIPDSLTSIGDYVFYDCTSLAEIIIPDGIESIGGHAFFGCTGLTSITMPCSASISSDAFGNCTAITSVHLTVGSGKMPDYTTSHYNTNAYSNTPWYNSKNNALTITLDEGIQNIGNYAFSYCTGLTEITIPDSVTSIGSYAFNSTGLTSVTIGDSVTSIGNSAFYGCTGLSSITMPCSTFFTNNTFIGCTAITSVHLTIGTGSMIDYSEPYNNNVTVPWYQSRSNALTVTMDEGIQNIGNYAFYDCIGLTQIKIPNSVTNIGAYAFIGCTGLTEIIIPDGVTSIGRNAFNRCSGLSEITIPNSVKDIDSGAFFQCTGLSKIMIPDSVIDIKENTFTGCTHLITVACGNNVSTIGDFAFAGCEELTSVTLGRSVTSVGYRAFYNCSCLTDVFYNGTQQTRNNIAIGSENYRFINATWHYLTPYAIEMKTLPDKLTYQVGEALDVTGGAITTYYDYEIVEEETITEDMLTGFDSSVAGMQTLTVTFEGQTTTFDVEVVKYEIEIDGTVEWNKNDVSFKGQTAYVLYDDKAHTPRFTVKDKNGKTVAASNYTYEYKENTKAGTGYVIVTMKNGYSGVCQGSFKIYLPATTETKVENTEQGIKVTWKAVKGAAGYVIYRRAWSSTTNGWTAFARWNNTTATTYIDGVDANHKVYAGTRYQYGVKAYFARRLDPIANVEIGGNVNEPSGNFNLGEVGPLKTTVRITTRVLNSVTPGSKQLTVKWGASSLFTGYEVQVATNSAFTQNVKTVKITKAKTTQTTIKSLKSGTTYYVRIRSYHEFEGMTYYGGWSAVKNCKVK